jgi:hypothetical protein
MSGGAERARPTREEIVVTLTTPVSPDLAGSACSVAECLESAQVMGSATVRLDPGMEAPADFRTVTFGLPLCADHAHLLRLGCTLSVFRSGL